MELDAAQLADTHPERATEVEEKYSELKVLWARITEMCELRGVKLEESFKYHKFLVHYRDLCK